MNGTYVKVRIRYFPNGEQSRYRAGKISSDHLDDDIADERVMYGRTAGVKSVDDADRTVVALCGDGTVRITQYR